MTRLSPGEKPPAGSTVYLLRGSLDRLQRIEHFIVVDPDWVCEQTVNGFWYGYEAVDTERKV